MKIKHFIVFSAIAFIANTVITSSFAVAMHSPMLPQSLISDLKNNNVVKKAAIQVFQRICARKPLNNNNFINSLCINGICHVETQPKLYSFGSDNHSYARVKYEYDCNTQQMLGAHVISCPWMKPRCD